MRRKPGGRDSSADPLEKPGFCAFGGAGHLPGGLSLAEASRNNFPDFRGIEFFNLQTGPALEWQADRRASMYSLAL